MKTINLLPKEEKVRDVKSIIMGIVMVIMVILLAVVSVFSIIVYNMNSELTPELEDHEKANMQINNYIKKLEVYNDFKGKVKEKEKAVEYIQELEISWSDVLADFSKKMPDGIYLTLMQVDSEELYKFISQARTDGLGDDIKGINYLIITGYALNNMDITKLLVQINNMEYTFDAKIDSMHKDYITESNIEVIAFTISANIDIEPFIEKFDLKKVETAPSEEEAPGEEVQGME